MMISIPPKIAVSRVIGSITHRFAGVAAVDRLALLGAR
jgi:hypothetical protein